MADADGVVWVHSDETYESAYAWSFDGVLTPDYGAFAERYETQRLLISIVLDVTSAGIWITPRLDAYVWDDNGGLPGGVLAIIPDVILSGIPYWPEVRRFLVELPEHACVESVWWVGFWGNWPESEPGFYIGAALNGPGGGRPMTKIAPGLEWPEGWQDVSVRWGPTSALGIGAEVEESPSPVESKTWGEIKSLFGR
jgi:hypothetical protein